MSSVLAVDGGNTKTLAAVAGAGRPHARGRQGRRRRTSTTRRRPTSAIDAIEAAAREALAAPASAPDARRRRVQPRGRRLAGGLHAARGRAARAARPARRRRSSSTTRSARCAAGRRTGPASRSSAGTYNAVGARHADGRVFHLGFWPDGAGGRDLGRTGLRAVYRAALEMGPATALVRARARAVRRADAIALLHEFTRRGGLTEAEGDRLAPVVLDAADAGDAVAQAIVAGKGAHPRPPGPRLRRRSSTCRSTACGSCSPAACSATRPSGSPPPRWPSCRARVAVRHPAPPIAGALLLALDRIGVRVDAATVAAGLPFPAPNRRSAAWAGSPSKA